ncbi:hypothetical protein T492DRAFT_862683, partial [Pavlovales sp. CCMP2436]
YYNPVSQPVPSIQPQLLRDEKAAKALTLIKAKNAKIKGLKIRHDQRQKSGGLFGWGGEKDAESPLELKSPQPQEAKGEGFFGSIFSPSVALSSILLEAAEYRPTPTMVKVPEGVGPGGLVAVERSDGQTVQVRVPSDAYVGSTFYATV